MLTAKAFPNRKCGWKICDLEKRRKKSPGNILLHYMLPTATFTSAAQSDVGSGAISLSVDCRGHRIFLQKSDTKTEKERVDEDDSLCFTVWVLNL